MSTVDPGLGNRNTRVLCLHGAGTNSEVFKAQTAALRYCLGPTFEYDFVDGSHPSPANTNINEVFGADQIYFSYADESAESMLQAVDDLAAYVDERGPFDAVLTFSAGAALAATLLIAQGRASEMPSFGSAVFLCATRPCDVQHLKAGRAQLLNATDAPGAIQIPTVHAWGASDAFRQEAEQLVGMCSAAARHTLVHSAGHGVPSHGEDLIELANAIKAVSVGSQRRHDA